MLGKFCTYAGRKIRLIGYAPKRARWLAGFFFTSMLVVCGMMGVRNVRPEGGYGWITNCRESPLVVRGAVDCPAFLVVSVTVR
jgi:hypothetical protein